MGFFSFRSGIFFLRQNISTKTFFKALLRYFQNICFAHARDRNFVVLIRLDVMVTHIGMLPLFVFFVFTSKRVTNIIPHDWLSFLENGGDVPLM